MDNKNRIKIKGTVNYVESNPMNVKTAFWISMVSGIIISMLALSSQIDFHTLKLASDSHIGLILPMNIFMSFAIYTFGFYILRSDQHLTKRIVVLVIGAFLIAVAFTWLTMFLSKWIYKGPNITTTFNTYAVKDIILATIAIMITILLFGINRRHRTLMEMERLRTSMALLSSEMLQKQLNPHFLFNSLTMLDNLIGHDDAKAKEYLHHLATTFRNTTDGGKPHTLREELDMVESYKYIINVRFGQWLHFKENIDEKRLSDYVVYFSLQLLLENIVKHNIISEMHPMLVTIETTDEGMLRVSNPLQLKKNKSNQQVEHIGLYNLDKRYMIIFGKHIVVTKTDNHFIVDIPLIPANDAQVAIKKMTNLS